MKILCNQKIALVMIFITFFISATCFPSLIVYKPLPGKHFSVLERQIEGVAFLGTINVGTFLIFTGFGALFRTEIDFRKNKQRFKAIFFVCIIMIDIFLVSFILYVTLNF